MIGFQNDPGIDGVSVSALCYHFYFGDDFSDVFCSYHCCHAEHHHDAYHDDRELCYGVVVPNFAFYYCFECSCPLVYLNLYLF